MLNEAYTVKQFYSAGSTAAGPMGLSLFVSPCSLIYAISVPPLKTITELAHVQLNDAPGIASGVTDRVSYLVRNYQLDRKKFDKVNIALLNTDFAMIPDAYAEQELIKPLLKFAVGDTDVKNIRQHALNSLKFCYTPDMELASELERMFPNAALRHAGAVSIQLLFGHHALKACNLFLQVHDGFIELAAKDKSRLLFYNVFNYAGNEDILYYLLFMMEQFDLDPQYARLALAIQRPADDELIKHLKKYIRQVDLCAHDPSVQLSGEALQWPSHYYFTVLNQHLCEL